MQAFIAMIITQALGFLILYLVLKKFAFGPVLKVIDDRRHHIRGELEQIREDRERLEQAQAEYEARLANIEDEARRRIRDAVAEGQQLAEQVKAQAQVEARQLLDKTRALLEEERARAAIHIRNQIVELALGAAEKLVRERLDDARHRALIEDFIEEMPTG